MPVRGLHRERQVLGQDLRHRPGAGERVPAGDFLLSVRVLVLVGGILSDKFYLKKRSLRGVGGQNLPTYLWTCKPRGRRGNGRVYHS